MDDKEKKEKEQKEGKQPEFKDKSTMTSVPDPVIPQFEDQNLQEQPTSSEEMDRDQLYQNVSNLLGFVFCLGLPEDWFEYKHNYYTSLAYQTGTAKALIETIEWYFPDFEASPLTMLLMSATPFLGLVLMDRMSVQKQIKADQQQKRQEGKPSGKQHKTGTAQAVEEKKEETKKGSAQPSTQ